MAYNKNIPQPTDKLRTSQPQLLENFHELDAWTQQDHVGLTGTSDQGKHQTARFIDQTSAPTINDPETGFFNAQPNNIGSLAISKQQMYVRAEQNNSYKNIPFTASILSTNQAPGKGAHGWTYLPSGILMKWGTYDMTQAGTETIDYPTGSDIPAFSEVFSVQATLANPTVAKPWSTMIVSFSPQSFSVFTFNTTNGTDRQAQIHYIAIGR